MYSLIIIYFINLGDLGALHADDAEERLDDLANNEHFGKDITGSITASVGLRSESTG